MSYAAPRSLTMIRGSEVSACIDADRETCVSIVRSAYLAHDRGESALPHSSFLRFPHRERDRIIALPAYLGGEFDVSGIKWIASYPENIRHEVPRASAVLILNDGRTGFPYGCLEASIISASRTAASAVLGAEALLGDRHAARVGFVGTGLIADHVRRFLSDLHWNIGGFRLFDLNRSAADRFASVLAAEGRSDVRVVDCAGDAFADCDLVVIATVAGSPHLHDPALLQHAPVVLHLSLRDLAPELVITAQNVTDDLDHAVREQTSLHLAEQKLQHRRFIDGTVADLVNGRLERDPLRAAIFSPFGLGVLDLAVGKWAYERIVAQGGGYPVDDFFPTMVTG